MIAQLTAHEGDLAGRQADVRLKAPWIDDRQDVAARFWAKVDRYGPGGCWLWTASKRNKGYGAFAFTGADGVAVQTRAHRLSFEAFNVPIPDGLCVLHRCDVPACVNPDHLFLGTKADNNRDMVKKGRHYLQVLRREGRPIPGHILDAVPKGERHSNSKLTADDVVAMRREYEAGGVSYSQIARVYGISLTQAYRIVKRQRWAHVL